ncbi:SGNH family hydrolase [Pseudomonas sp. zfem004]|uniref:SGNH/GDSL hydrolase family protein n=1 Tax=unclassified Pseudomonas TaxID=196821 RepID=UPI0021140460|nr:MULTISPECIES: SGNH family hydrolase [unclassified Pseudomonas]MDU9403614.1 SGNH family hydrolase [Pseudomonas sp. zfem004]
MQASDSKQLFQVQMGAARALYAIVVTTALLFWLNQDSIRLYCQQKYHQSCEIPLLGPLPAWRFGAQLTAALEQGRDSLIEQLQAAQQQVAGPVPEVLPAPIPVVTVNLETPAALAQPLPAAPVAKPVAPPEHAPQPQVAVATPPAPAAPDLLQPGTVVSLAAGDDVLLVGDSLMQGVAPHLANSLRKRYQIRTVNLSKQSTGLAYPGFFNWPKTVAETLAHEPNIRLMVVFLGPNDPWDMPQGKGKPFLRFKSPEWEVAYRARIDSILDQARVHNVQVLWVGPPNMEKPRLSTAMGYLSGLYQQQTALFGQHYVSANPILGYADDGFAATVLTPEGKRVKVRVDDGIHFTITGQKMIAAQVLSLISLPGLTVTGH